MNTQALVAPKNRSIQVQKMLEILSTSYSQIHSSFDLIPITELWRRRAVKEYFASKQVQDLEDKIEEQCLIVLRSESENVREEALRKVAEGMDYLVKLMMNQMGRKEQ